MATSWAVMALSLALPPARTRSALDSEDVLQARVEPWAEAVLFGSADEVRSLLRNGLDPNSTDAQGTTALMMAIPNEEKVRLLIEAGADVNAKAQSGFTPLMVATAYRGTSNIVRFLLSKGAVVNPGDPPPVYNASAAFLAVVAGDTTTLQVLLDAAADITRKMFTFGFIESDAFEWAAFGGDPANVKYLAGRMSAEKRGEALIISVISNRSRQARDMLEAGANVNYVDKHGMTPLLYAASLDFGSTEIMETLLRSGADIKAKTKDGHTALMLARRYGYSAFQRALERAGVIE
jgi:ankyrin repeat protein